MPFNNRWFWIIAVLSIAAYYLINSLTAICFPFILGFIGAYALDGTVARMERLHISRGIGSGLMVITVIMVFVVMLMVFIPFVQEQLISLATSAPIFMENWIETLTPSVNAFAEQMGMTPPTIESHLSNHIGDVFSWSLKIITNFLTNGMALANIISLIILTPIIMFYILKDWPRMIQAVTGVLPYKNRDLIISYAQRIDATLSDYARGQAMVCLILMVVYAIALSILGIKDGLFIGVLTGFMSFIPYVGMLLGLLATLASAFTHFEGWNQIAMIFAIFGVFNLIEGNFLSPRLVGERVGVHPVWVIFALLAGATWFGFLGVLVALPVAAITGVVVRIVLEAYKSSELFNEYLTEGQKPKTAKEPL